MKQIQNPSLEIREEPQVRFGTTLLSIVLIFVYGYALNAVLTAPKSLPIYLSLAAFAIGILMAAGGVILSLRRRQGIFLTFYSVILVTFALPVLLQGRAVPATLMLTIVSLVGYFWLFPQDRAWRLLAVSGVELLLIWGVELLDPAWRQSVGLFPAGPAGAVIFLVLAMFSILFRARRTIASSMRLKFLATFTLSVFLAVVLVGIGSYVSYQRQIRAVMRQRLLNIISIAALQQDGDLFATIQTTEDQTGEAYQTMQAVNASILATDRDLAYIFSARVDGQGKMTFVVDSGLEEGYDPVDVGVVYDDPSELLAKSALTLDKPIVEEDFYTDQYGTFLSAYAPIYDSAGRRQGIVGVDIFADKILEQERQALLVIPGSVVVVLLFVGMIGFYLGNAFTKPITDLSNVARLIIAGDFGAVADVQTTDEVGELATAFNTMTSQLRATLASLESRVEERTRNLEIASEVGRAVSQVGDLQATLTNAAELIRSSFDLYYTQIYLTNPSKTYLEMRAGTGEVGKQLLERSHRLPLDSSSLNGRAALDRKTIVIEDTAASATFKPNALLPNTRSEMTVPLLLGDVLVGVLDMQSAKPGYLNPDVVSAFEALAGQLAIAIQNANFLQEIRAAQEELQRQSSSQSRQAWQGYMDAIHQPEALGFIFQQNQITPLTEELPPAPQALAAPIEISSAPLGNLSVEMDEGAAAPIAKSAELVEAVAKQISQRIEALRLLETAERYRAEAEESSRRLTVTSWEQFAQHADQPLRYLYDLKQVQPLDSDVAALPNITELPLTVRGADVGKLTIQDVNPEDRESLDLANAVAERLSAHIESLRQFEETQRSQAELDRRAQQLAAVAEVSTVSAQELDIEKMLQTVVNLTQRKFGLYHAHVFTYDENLKRLQIVACGYKEGDEHEGTHGTTAIPIEQEQSLVARAARTRQPVIVNDVRSDPGWLPNPLLPDTASEMAVPMIVGDQILGVLDVQSEQVDAFTDEDANIHTTLASQVATALQNALSFAKAQEQAQRESALNAISQKIQSATSVEAVLQIAARELGHALGAPMTIAQLSMKEND